MECGAQLEVFVGCRKGGWRVFWGAGGHFLVFTAASARALAPSFETDEAKAAEVGFIADWLREAADACDAKTAVIQ